MIVTVKELKDQTERLLNTPNLYLRLVAQALKEISQKRGDLLINNDIPDLTVTQILNRIPENDGIRLVIEPSETDDSHKLWRWVSDYFFHNWPDRVIVVPPSKDYPPELFPAQVWLRWGTGKQDRYVYDWNNYTQIDLNSYKELVSKYPSTVFRGGLTSFLFYPKIKLPDNTWVEITDNSQKELTKEEKKSFLDQVKIEHILVLIVLIGVLYLIKK